MDNASAYGAEDSRFESWQDRIFFSSDLLLKRSFHLIYCIRDNLFQICSLFLKNIISFIHSINTQHELNMYQAPPGFYSPGELPVTRTVLPHAIHIHYAYSDYYYCGPITCISKFNIQTNCGISSAWTSF